MCCDALRIGHVRKFGDRTKEERPLQAPRFNAFRGICGQRHLRHACERIHAVDKE